jgi:hypothetical protein
VHRTAAERDSSFNVAAPRPVTRLFGGKNGTIGEFGRFPKKEAAMGSLMLRLGVVGLFALAVSLPSPAAPRDVGGKHRDAATFEIADGVQMAFCWVPPGTGTLGAPDSERGRETKDLAPREYKARGFWLGKEVRGHPTRMEMDHRKSDVNDVCAEADRAIARDQHIRRVLESRPDRP